MVLTMFRDNSQEVLGDLETKYASLGTAQEFLKFFSMSKNYQNFLEVVQDFKKSGTYLGRFADKSQTNLGCLGKIFIVLRQNLSQDLPE